MGFININKFLLVIGFSSLLHTAYSAAQRNFLQSRFVLSPDI